MNIPHECRLANAVAATPDPRLDLWLRRGVWLGCTLLLLPAMRGHSEWLGWMPLWVLGMPLAAWWALHRFRLPRWVKGQSNDLGCRRRRRGVQARRRRESLVGWQLSKAA